MCRPPLGWQHEKCLSRAKLGGDAGFRAERTVKARMAGTEMGGVGTDKAGEAVPSKAVNDTQGRYLEKCTHGSPQSNSSETALWLSCGKCVAETGLSAARQARGVVAGPDHGRRQAGDGGERLKQSQSTRERQTLATPAPWLTPFSRAPQF